MIKPVSKFVKALEYITKLKGAELIKDDLFAAVIHM